MAHQVLLKASLCGIHKDDGDVQDHAVNKEHRAAKTHSLIQAVAVRECSLTSSHRKAIGWPSKVRLILSQVGCGRWDEGQYGSSLG